jgi:hypothetical protein
MKKIVFAILTAPLFTGCAKLDENAPFIESGNFYRTQDDAIAAVTAVYGQLSHDVGSGTDFGLYQRQLHLTTDLISDDATAGAGATNTNVRNMGDVTFVATNDRIEKTWRQHYAGINRANAAIDHIEKMTFNEALRKRLIGESKFIRGLLYFNIVRLWGPSPITLHETTGEAGDILNLTRSSVDSVYKQIIADLTAAETVLPNAYAGSDVGRVTQGAVKSLLVKVYLTRKDWANAITKAKEVINGPYGYDLFDDFADVFKIASKNGKEHIFSVQFKSISGNSNNMGILAMPNGAAATPSGAPLKGNEADVPQTGLYELYSASDKRRDVTFYTEIVINNIKYTFKPHFKKYLDPSTAIANPTLSGANFPVLRYSDVLLMYAEALNEQSGPTSDAYEALNQVVRRAYGKAVHTPDAIVDIKNVSQADFRNTVYLQRRLEFVYEMQRWYDLVRTGRMLDELHAHGKPNAKDYNYLLPVPQREIDVNQNLKPQNAGYN